MKEIIDEVKKDVGAKNKYYLLGVDKFKSKLMDHEICHGLYYTDPDYKKSCDAIIDESLGQKNREKLKKIIMKMGYDESVVDDEIQAYLSTGVHPEMKKIKGINTIAEKFKKNFKKYKKRHDLDS